MIHTETAYFEGQAGTGLPAFDVFRNAETWAAMAEPTWVERGDDFFYFQIDWDDVAPSVDSIVWKATLGTAKAVGKIDRPVAPGVTGTPADADVGVVNLALDHLQISQKIITIDDAVEAARAAKRHYHIVRTKVLKLFPWECAAKREVLTRDTETANLHPQWAYAFVPPTGMIQPRGFVLAGYRNTPPDWKIPFICENLPDASAKRIYTNFCADSTMPFNYTFDLTDVSKMSSGLVAVFAMALALRMAKPLRVDQAIFKNLMALWPSEVADAIADEMSNGFEPPPDASWILARL